MRRNDQVSKTKIDRRYEGGPQKTGIILWREGPFVVQLPQQDVCSRNPSVSVYLLVLLWETAFGFSEFFLKTFSVCFPISRWVIYERTMLHRMFGSFWLKMAGPQCPTLPRHPILPGETFLFLSTEKVLKEKHFAFVEEVKQKMAEALKGINIDKFKNCFEQWKNVLIGVLHQMESTLKV